jgi:TPR repeat protein
MLSALTLAACAEQSLPARPDWNARQLDAHRRCGQGSVAACGELGQALLGDGEGRRGADFNKDQQRGLVLLEAACGQDDMPACTALGRAYLEDFGPRDKGGVRARELLTRACDRKFGPGCTNRGFAELSDTGVGEAAAFFRAGCDLGDAEGCERYGQVVSRGPSGGDAPAAEAAWAKSCALGSVSGCHRLAVAWLRDPARRAAGFRRLAEACQRGFAPSCREVALLSAPLVSAQPDCKRAAPFALQACRGRDVDGCAVNAACRLAAADSRADAIAELRKGCDGGAALACLYWADAVGETASPEELKQAYRAACRYDTPAGAIACPRVVIRALATATMSYEAEPLLDRLREACSQSSGEACCALAAEYETGKWTRPDPTKVSELRARACALTPSPCCRR